MGQILWGLLPPDQGSCEALPLIIPRSSSKGTGVHKGSSSLQLPHSFGQAHASCKPAHLPHLPRAAQDGKHSC